MLILNDDTHQCRVCYEDEHYGTEFEIVPGRVAWTEGLFPLAVCATCGLSDKEIKEIENATP